jgi:hypothetical protein
MSVAGRKQRKKVCDNREDFEGWIPQEIPRPIFSLAERDRRWSRAREAMAKENLDGLLAPATLEEGDTLYLTQVGGRTKEAWVIFARDPAKPIIAIVESNRVKSFWLSAQNWLGDENFRLSSANLSESGLIRKGLFLLPPSIASAALCRKHRWLPPISSIGYG